MYTVQLSYVHNLFDLNVSAARFITIKTLYATKEEKQFSSMKFYINFFLLYMKIEIQFNFMRSPLVHQVLS